MRFSIAQLFTSLIQLTIGIIEILLALRIVLTLFSANPNTPLVALIYKYSQIFLSPFKDIFPVINLDQHTAIDLTTLFAIVIYSIIGYLLTKLISIIYTFFVNQTTNKPTPTDMQYRG